MCTALSFAETDYASKGIFRKVVFTMNDEEELDQSLYDDPEHFIIMTRFVAGYSEAMDDIYYHYSVIINGERKYTMTNAYNYTKLDSYHPENCMIEYLDPDKSEGVYVKSGDQSFGPYTSVLIRRRTYPYGGETDYRTSFEHYKPNQFEFWYDDEHFLHEDDGFVHKYSKRRKDYSSPNKQFKVIIGDGNPLQALSINGRNYDLTSTLQNYRSRWYYDPCATFYYGEDPEEKLVEKMAQNPSEYTTDCCIFDDGACLYRIINIKGDSNDKYDFYIKGDSTRRIMNYIVEHELIEGCDAYENYDACCNEYKYYEYYDHASHSILRHKIEDEDDNKCESMKLVLDPSGKHHFIIDYDNKVAFIDSMRFDISGVILPWTIEYQEKEKTFRWVCLEGKDLVYYSYTLN
jgi:hypothetical protein